MNTEDKDLFDPETGRPLSGSYTPEARFDPETGKPLRSPDLSEDRFDPETGEPLRSPDLSEDRFDPETGKPLTGSRPDLFDPETGKRISSGAARGRTAAILAGKGKIFLAAGAAAVAGAAVIGTVAGSGLFKNKKDIVADALTGIVETIDEGYLERTFGLKDLQEMARNGSVAMGGSLSTDEIPGWSSITALDASLAFMRDPGKNAVRWDGAAGVGGMDWGTASLYMDDKEIAVAAPEFTDSVLVMNYRDNFGEKLKNSELGSMLWVDEEATDDVGRILGRMNEALTGKKEYFNFEDMYERYKETTKATEILKDAMEVKSVGSKKFIVNGKKQKCKGYEVVIPNEALADFIKSAGKYFTSDKTIKENELEMLTDILTLTYEAANFSPHDTARRYAKQQVDSMLDAIKSGSNEIEDFLDDYVEDLELILYVDKKGNAAHLEAAAEIQAYGSCEISAEFDFEGGAVPTRDMNGVITLDEGGRRTELEVTKKEKEDRSMWDSQMELEFREGSSRNTFSFNAEHDKKEGDFSVEGALAFGGTSTSAELSGVVLDHKKGKSLSLEIDTIAFQGPYDNFDTDLVLSLFIEPLSGGLKMPSGKKMDVLKATKRDWEDLEEEVEGKARELIDVL